MTPEQTSKRWNRCMDIAQTTQAVLIGACCMFGWRGVWFLFDCGVVLLAIVTWWTVYLCLRRKQEIREATG